MSDFTPKPYYIAYFDVLGYETHAKTDAETAKFAEKISEIIELQKTISYTSNEIQEIFKNEKSPIELKIFSDNFLLYTEKSAYELATMTQALQRSMSTGHGIFIRGALYYGNLFVNSEFLVGNGLEKAYKLESQIAIYPRVLIDETFFNATTEVRREAIKRLQKKDFDGFFFLDYLQSPIKNKVFVESMIEEERNFVIAHCRQIKENLDTYKSNKRVLQKYLWCKNYHNQFCEENGYKEFLIT